MLKELLDWVQQQGSLAPLLFGLLYIGCAVAFVPGSILTLSAGAAFGLAYGVIIVSLASTTAAAVSLLLGRYAFRKRILRRLEGNARFAAIDAAVTREGWKMVLLLRLSPVFPFSLLNYALGLTGVRFWPAVFASWIGMLPGTILYVYIGSLARLAVQDDTADLAKKILYGVGLLATLVVTIMVTRIAKRALAKQIDADGVPSSTR